MLGFDSFMVALVVCLFFAIDIARDLHSTVKIYISDGNITLFEEELRYIAARGREVIATGNLTLSEIDAAVREWTPILNGSLADLSHSAHLMERYASSPVPIASLAIKAAGE